MESKMEYPSDRDSPPAYSPPASSPYPAPPVPGHQSQQQYPSPSRRYDQGSKKPSFGQKFSGFRF